MGEDVSKFIKVLMIFVIVFFAAIFSFVGVRLYKTENAEVTEVELQVVDKIIDSNIIYTGTVPITTHSYKLIVELGGQRHRVTTTSIAYQEIEVGDSMLFKIYYDSKDQLVSIGL